MMLSVVRIAFLAASLLLLVSSNALADTKPEVKSVLPLGVMPGRTTTVFVYGDNLAPKSVTIGKPGASVKLIGVKPTDEKTKSRGGAAVTIELTLPANLPGENLDIQLVQPDGSKLPAPVAVVDSVSSEIQVKKPSSTYQTAMSIPSKSVAITGTLDGDTADVFKIEAKAGETWDVSLLCGRGGSQADPVLRIRDFRHITLLLSAGDKKKDRHLLFRAPADGTYYIDITEAEAKGGAGFDYRLTLK